MALPALIKEPQPTTNTTPYRHRFTVDEFYRMLDAGIFTEDDRVELIEGDIVTMTPIGARHAACVKRLNALLNRVLGERAIIGVQDPLRLDEKNEVLPDITVLRFRPDFYAEAHPGPGDVLLVVEVAKTSLAYDREVKVALYARYGVPEYWLVNLQDNVVEVYRRPFAQGYKETLVFAKGDTLTPALLPDVHIAVQEIVEI